MFSGQTFLITGIADENSLAMKVAEKIIEKCLEFAKTQGFEICYLETLSFMTTAQKLYKRIGFENIDGPMGNTGHNSCEVWMTKKL